MDRLCRLDQSVDGRSQKQHERDREDLLHRSHEASPGFPILMRRSPGHNEDRQSSMVSPNGSGTASCSSPWYGPANAGKIPAPGKGKSLYKRERLQGPERSMFHCDFPIPVFFTGSRARGLRGRRGAYANAKDGAICATPWPRSGGCVRG